MQSDLLNSQDLVKTSFFDDVSEKIQADEYPLNVFWVSPKEFQNFSKKNSHVSQTILYEGYLMSRSKKINNMKKRHYVLYEDRIVCYKVKKKKLIIF